MERIGQQENSTMSASREELAWAAGFIDGEGSFTSHNGGTYPRLSATQAHKEPLERLQKLWGGTVGVQRPSREGRKTIYYWELYGFAKVQNAFAQMYTWLGKAKRDKAILVLRAHTDSNWRVGRGLK